MKTTDIDLTAQPEDQRFTAHLFSPDKRPGLGGDPTLLLGSPLQMSDVSEWPPVTLFNAVYADAVLHHFGTWAPEDEVTETWKDTFYPGGVMTAASADYKLLTDERATRAQEPSAGA